MHRNRRRRTSPSHAWVARLDRRIQTGSVSEAPLKHRSTKSSRYAAFSLSDRVPLEISIAHPSWNSSSDETEASHKSTISNDQILSQEEEDEEHSDPDREPHVLRSQPLGRSESPRISFPKDRDDHAACILTSLDDDSPRSLRITHDSVWNMTITTLDGPDVYPLLTAATPTSSYDSSS